MDDTHPNLDCPACGEAMSLARVTPKLGPHPDLFTFECGGCGEVLTTIGESGTDNSSD